MHNVHGSQIKRIAAEIVSSLLVLHICGCAPLNRITHTLNEDGCRAPLTLVADPSRNLLYIAETETRDIAVFDIASEKVTERISLKEEPSGLVLSPDSSTLIVTCSSPKGTIALIDLENLSVMKTIRTDHSPCSPVMSTDGKILYVCNRFENTVSVIDYSTGKGKGIIPMLREPVASVLSPDGRYLFVANHLPTGRRIYDYVTDGGIMMIGSYMSSGYHTGSREKYAASGVVLVVDTEYNRLVELIPLTTGSTELKGICMSPDGRYVYITHVLARYNIPTTQLERGWMNTNALSIIDAENLSLVNTVLLDDVDNGAANPWDAVCSDDGAFLAVTHAGTHEVSIIDRAGLHERLEKLKNGCDVPCASTTIEDVPNDLTFLTGLRRRINLAGNGPRGIAFAGRKLYIAEYFTGTLSIVDLEQSPDTAARSVVLGSRMPLTLERRGEMYFNDADLCFQQWQSCASCHPDGRADALNWDLLNDGIGNPKNTKSLLLSHRTPPSMITGVRERPEDAVRAGVRHILFVDKSDDIIEALNAYLASLEPVSSPFLVRGKLSKEARHGRKLFEKAGCKDCHPPPLYTDLKKYDAGTGTGRDKNREFDTPTLLELWRTAPYLYDGRTDTLYEVLRDYNFGDKHGVTSKLSNKELYDLIEFLLSL